jgi:hypothetical protein
VLEGGIDVVDYAREDGSGVVGVWGVFDVVYALIHELGGTIVPKVAKALKIPMPTARFRFVKSVTIPARPYLRPAADKPIRASPSASARPTTAGSEPVAEPADPDRRPGRAAARRRRRRRARSAARVFGGELPEAEAQHMPRAALVVAPSGGVRSPAAPTPSTTPAASICSLTARPSTKPTSCSLPPRSRCGASSARSRPTC